MKPGFQIFVFGIISLANSVIGETREETALNQLLADYDPRVKPEGNTTVSAQMYIRQIFNLDTIKGEFAFQVTFRQEWVDPRLRMREPVGLFLTVSTADRIWTPDTFFRNEIESKIHHDMAPNLYYRIYPDGRVLFSSRLTLRTSCPMNLKAYPHDSQTCSVQVASYGWPAEHLTYVWRSDPIQMVRYFHTIGYNLMEFGTDSCDVVTSTGRYSCIEASFTFQRRSSYVILILYVPSIMFAVLSWFSCWLSPGSVSGRLCLGLVSQAAVAGMSLLVNMTLLPPTAYTKSVDVWMGFMNLFVFLNNANTILAAFFFQGSEKPEEQGSLVERWRSASLGSKLDMVNRLLFLPTVGLFVLFYFAAV